MISIKRLSGNGFGDWKPQVEMGWTSLFLQGKGGLHHWLLGDFTSSSLSFPIWKSGLIITIRIQCSDVHIYSA